MHTKQNNRIVAFIVATVLYAAFGAQAKQIITITPTASDMTPIVRAAIESATDPDLKLIFEKGSYTFRPDYATDQFCFITNHGNGFKKIIFPLEGFDSVEIDGNGSEFIFHGQLAPFQFEGCDQVIVKNLTLDWDIPFTFLGEVMAINEQDGWRDIKPFTQGFSWKLDRDRVLFPNIDGFNYTELGSTLAFDATHKRVVHGALDMHSNPQWVEQRADGILRFHEKLKQYPPVGSLLSSKGDREHDRYAPAFQIKSSKNVHLDTITIHHALGMGFLFERTENITISNSRIMLRKGSDRVISSTADATHFCNCKGDILVENCRFENMLDDGTNVHGTYVIVDKVIDSHTVRIALDHFEQLGFEFAAKGDAIWFIQNPSPKRAGENEVSSVKIINDKYSELTFKTELPATLAQGDILENKTWNPTFTMRGCTIRNHRARNVVIKTPLKIVIEDNDFSSMMSSIFFRGETYYWFESGAVTDVVIRNNRFNYCAYSGMEHAVLYITPRLGKTFNQTELYDRNIRFENNSIKTFDQRIVWADRVDGLIIKGNIIEKIDQAKALYPNAPLFDFKHCRNVELTGNSYQGSYSKSVQADSATAQTLTVEDNIGF